MTRKGKVYRKWLAGLLTAVFVMTSAPEAAFADEAAGDVPEIEAAESFEAADEAVYEEGSNEDVVTDEEVFDANVTSPSGRTYTDAIPAEPEKTSTAVLHPNEEYETNKWDRSRFFVYDIKKTGYYNFKANCDVNMSYELGHDDDKYSSTQQRTYMTVNTGNANKDDVFLHDGKYYLKLYTTSDEETVEASFTLSFKEDVYRSSEESPENIDLNQEVSHQLNNISPRDDDDKVYDRHFFALNLDSAGVATVKFTDDYNSTSNHTCMVITHADNTSEAKFEETIETNKYEYFNSTSFHWIDKDTVRLSLPRKGTYNIKIYCTDLDKRPKYTFSFKDFTPLKAEKNEELFEDKKLGGSNDWLDPLDNDWGGYYGEDRNGPMPEIKIGQKYRSILTSDSKVDYFKFTLAKEGPLFITAEAPDIGQLEFAMTKYEPKLNMYSSITVKPDPFTAYANKPFNNQQLQIQLDKTGVWQFYDNFPAGDYTIYVHADRGYFKDNTLNKFGSTGIYTLMLSTSKSSGDSKNTAKPVTKLTLDNSVLTMNPGEEKTLTAMVAPLTADDTGVKFEVTGDSDIITLSENIIKEDDKKKKVANSTVKITANKKGKAVIKVTTTGKNKKDQPLEATCTVSVIEGKTDCPAVAVKQKVDLSGAEYFGQTFDKNDVFEVDIDDKAYGSVTNKGIFTAKKDTKDAKDGYVTVTWKKKEGKNKNAVGSVSFKIETPDYVRKDKNNKPVKTVNVYKRTATVSPDEVISTNLISPSGYLCSDTKGTNFDFDEKTGIVTAKKTGSCKITVLYGDNDKKLATKAYTYTVKATLPTIKSDVSIKNNKKPTVVKLTKVQADVQKAGKIEWRLEGVSGNGIEPDGIEVRSSCIEYKPVTTEKEATNLMSCTITPTDDAKVGDAAFLIVKVDGVDYWCKVTIKK